ncbi:hypothetical protein CCYA_CCYA20G4797 [Cyanidiococcus yangmingshanensis]|nr:hypothetical protein CCYA_CCYA20G4797 [Cyanidiococcus yangmingshanensis]
MGTVLGKVSVETPKYELLSQTERYEIRKYAPLVAAEVRASEIFGSGETQKRQLDSMGFRLLAKYIGAIGKPANHSATGQDPEAVAMTAPVVNKPEQIAMTAPVVTTEVEGAPRTRELSGQGTSGDGKSSRIGGTMAFYLPSKYDSIEKAPVPEDKRIHLVQIPARKVAVCIFSGNVDMISSRKQAIDLFQVLRADRIPMKGEPKTLDEAVWSLARYNPPWSLPWRKRNEVQIELEM